MGSRKWLLQFQHPCCKWSPFLWLKKRDIMLLKIHFPNFLVKEWYKHLRILPPPPPLLKLRYKAFDKLRHILPVHEMESTPGPWYSTMAPVPPFTVRIPATFRITSLGEVHPFSFPVSFTPITYKNIETQPSIIKGCMHMWCIARYSLKSFKIHQSRNLFTSSAFKCCQITNLWTLEFPWQSSHDIYCISPTDSDT